MSNLARQFNQRYQVTFYERLDPSRRLLAWLGDSPPTPSAGGGGYNVVALPMRSAVTVWQGRGNLMLMDIPIMLWNDQVESEGTRVLRVADNNLRSRTIKQPLMVPMSIRSQVSILMDMWRPADDTQPPPVIRVSSHGYAVPFTHLPWVVNDITWGAAIGDDQADRVMQQMTVQVMEYRADEVLQATRLRTPVASSKRAKTYVVKSGDTLQSIARRFNLTNGWRQLGNAQNPVITDPRQIKVGQKLTIPA